MHRLIKDCQPDELYNFAALSQVAHSFKNAIVTFETNARAVVSILESIVNLELQSKTVVYHASTSEMFGDHK